TMKKGEISQPVLAGTKVVIAMVSDVVPPHPGKLEDSQSQIKTAIEGRRTETVLRRHAEELVAKAQSMGGDLAKAAKSMGLEVKNSGDVDRAGNIEGLGSASYISEGFGRPDGSILAPITTPDRATIISKVIAHTPADMSQLAAQRNTIRDEIKSQR